MKRRSVEIIQRIIFQQRKSLNIITLAKEFEVSTKTLRNDMKEINRFLISKELFPIGISDDGDFILGKDFDEEFILGCLYDLNIYDYKLSPKERQVYILIALVTSNQYITMKQQAEELYVTRITVLSDVDAIKTYLKSYQVELLIDSGKGMLLKGAYEDKQCHQLKVS